MQDKELEKILQEKADQGKKREFPQVWKDIKGEIVGEEKPPKKFNFKRWFPMMLTSAVLVVCLAFTPLIIKSFKPAEEVYYSEELSSQMVTEEVMLDGLLQSSITHVDLTRYVLESCNLLVTEENVAKGAFFRFYNNQTTFFVTTYLYDKQVDLEFDIDKLYDSNCKIGSTTVYYKFVQDSSGLHEYTAYAVHNDVQYVMQYMGMPDTLEGFLTDFFA